MVQVSEQRRIEPPEPEAGAANGAAHHAVDIPVSRARAYDAYATGFAEWWRRGLTRSGGALDRIEIDPHEGGSITELTRGGREIVLGSVLIAEPGERFAHTLQPVAGAAASTITLTFEDRPHGGTRVELTHEGPSGGAPDEGTPRISWPKLLKRYRDFATRV